MNPSRHADREMAEWLALQLENNRALQASKSSTKQISPWQRRAQQAAVIAVPTLILASVVLAIVLPITMSRARRAAEAASRAAAAVSAGSCPTAPTVTRLSTSDMSLVFEDTFQTFNTSTWRYDLGDGSIYGLEGFGNGEVQASEAECSSLQESAAVAAASGLLYDFSCLSVAVQFRSIQTLLYVVLSLLCRKCCHTRHCHVENFVTSGYSHALQ